MIRKRKKSKLYTIILVYNKGGSVMHKQLLHLYQSENNTLRAVIKNQHARLIFLELIRKDNNLKIAECYYVDRVRNGKFYAVPQKLISKTFTYNELLTVIEHELNRKYYGIETINSLSDLTTEEFICRKLREINQGYKFLIFIGKGDSINGIPSFIQTRFKNRIHRSIYLEMQYRNNKGVITDCHYYDREYKARNRVIPETLNAVYFEYNRQTILNIINNELNTAFTDIIFVTDGSLNIDNEMPLCGYI